MAGFERAPFLAVLNWNEAWGKGAKGVARSGFPPCSPSERLVRRCSAEALAPLLARFDARLGCHGAVLETV